MGAQPMRDTASDNIAVPNEAAAQQQALRRMVEDVERHQRALEDNPGDVDTVLSAAKFCQEIGKVQEASALFVQAMTLAPDRPEGYAGMSQLLRAQGMHSEAVDMLKDAIARHPNSAPLWHAIAQIMVDLDDVEMALTFYEEALRLAPDAVDVRLRRAAYLLAHARPAEALRDCDLLRATHPRDSRVLVGWGDIKVSQGQRADARIAFTAALAVARERKGVEDRLQRLAIMEFTAALPRETVAQDAAPAAPASSDRFSLAYFHVDIPADTASPFEKPDYHAMLAKSIAVARAKSPRARIVVLSDDKTQFANDLGAHQIVRRPVDVTRLMFERMRMERDFLATCEPGSAVVFADTDVIVNRDPAPLFDGSFDVALTWRANPFDAPFNGGVALYRGTPAALRFYDHMIATHRTLENFPAVRARFNEGMARWWGHQLAMAATIGWDEFAQRTSDRLRVDGTTIRFFPERTHNFAMTATSVPNAAAHGHRYFLHFKGSRKEAFWRFAEQLAPASAAPSAAPALAGSPSAIDLEEARDPRRFTYDLGVAPISYDVVWFLGMARNRGIKHVDIVPGPHFGFRDDGWYQKADVAEKHFRLWNIVVPACQLAGMTVSVRPDRTDSVRTIYRPEPLFVEGIKDDVFHATDHSRRWVRQWLAARGLTKPVVITLRESHWASRNSNMDAWRRFAAETNAVVIPDTEGEVAFGHVFDGINMDRRLALYQEASVCMGTNGGPLALVFMTRSIPYLIFKMVSDYPASTVEAYAKRGFPVGTQFRWAGPHQRLVWADDDYDTIRAAYDVFLARNAR